MSVLKNRLLEYLQKIARVLLEPSMKTAVLDVKGDVLAAQYLQPFLQPYFPWTTGSLRPGCLITIVNDIILNQRKMVVELGGGLSTMVISRVLRNFGGNLYTIEEDQHWAAMLNTSLNHEQLSSQTTVLHAPLQFLPEQGFDWYDQSIIQKNLRDKTIDLLIVDGPGVGQLRSFAIPFFRPFLGNDYCIILDDLPRGGKKFLPLWEKELGIKFRVFGDFAWGTTNPDVKLFLVP